MHGKHEHQKGRPKVSKYTVQHAPIQDLLQDMHTELGKSILKRGEQARDLRRDSSGCLPTDQCNDIGRLCQAIKCLSELRTW